MKDGNFARAVATKEGGRKEQRRRNNFVIGEKQLELFLTNQIFRRIFRFPT
jgi:hypothetical protein